MRVYLKAEVGERKGRKGLQVLSVLLGQWKAQLKVLPQFSFALFYTFWTEKAMAPRSSTLAWKIPWTEEPGRLQSMGSLRVGHN